eukprot:m.51850 g.51850  ORF g.51850 m.51850 type:complete len:630 (+) comp10757_c0_seq1:134-2023(+)
MSENGAWRKRRKPQNDFGRQAKDLLTKRPKHAYTRKNLSVINKPTSSNQVINSAAAGAGVADLFPLPGKSPLAPSRKPASSYSVASPDKQKENQVASPYFEKKSRSESKRPLQSVNSRASPSSKPLQLLQTGVSPNCKQQTYGPQLSARNPSNFYGSKQSTDPFKKSSSFKELGALGSSSISKFLFEDDGDPEGFKNSGNTCYVNSALQSLLATPSFIADLLSPKLAQLPFKEDSLYRALCDVVESFRKRRVRKNAMSASKVKACVGRLNNRFQNFAQQDAHEFLATCLDGLHTEVVEAMKQANPNLTSHESQKRVNELSPVFLNFSCEITHRRSCVNSLEKGCASEPIKEHFRDFSLDIPPEDSLNKHFNLQQAFENFFKTEDVEYSCETCNAKKAKIEHKITKLPRILVIHLKRFNLSTKIKSAVNIPNVLSLAVTCGDSEEPNRFSLDNLKYIKDIEPTSTENRSASSAASAILEPGTKRRLQFSDDEDKLSLEEKNLQRAIHLSLEQAQKDNNVSSGDEIIIVDSPVKDAQRVRRQDDITPPKDGVPSRTEYCLTSIIRHEGDGRLGGHYICDALNISKGIWQSYNDKIVTKIDDGDICNESRRKNGYVFFYQHALTHDGMKREF